MEFSLNKSVLFKEMSLLQGVVEKKNTIPILSNVLIETVNESTISLVATDLDVSLQTECVADVSRPGSVVLQAKKLFDIVRNLPDSEIHFVKEDNERVKINCGSSEFKIVGQAKEHFPSTPQSNETGLAIEASILHNLIGRTIYAITQEESRYALNGALFLLEGNRLQMVATDGHRLALASSALEESSALNGADSLRVIIPKKALSELAKLTASSDETLDFKKDDNHLFFRIGRRQLTSRMLAGQFPNYELVLPKNNDKIVPLNSEKLAQAIRRVALMADERSHGVKFELSKSTLNITSQSADVGEAKEVIAVDYDSNKLGIGFNAQYLLDFLNVVATEEINLELKDEQSPALMRPAQDAKFDYRYVVMPMRLA
jgi:DNA polymerase-3 subunit beta